jgi:hypothetical protein
MVCQRRSCTGCWSITPQRVQEQESSSRGSSTMASHADHHLGQVRPRVLRVATLAQPRVGAVEFAVGELVLEVGARGVEEDLIDIQRQQVRDREEHRLAQRVEVVEQPVHRPVARGVVDLRQAGDVGLFTEPAGRLKLR